MRRALYSGSCRSCASTPFRNSFSSIKLVQTEVGQGNAAVRPPRLELVGAELTEVTALIRERLACRPKLDAPRRQQGGALASSGVA